jgi:protein TonB
VKEGRIRYFPLKAVKGRVSGTATLDCLVEADGWFTDCRIASEEPTGYDFGATALTMAPLFRANPAVAGQRMQTPLKFKPPE